MILYFTHWEENSIEYFCYTTGCEQGEQKSLEHLGGWRNSHLKFGHVWKDFISAFFQI